MIWTPEQNQIVMPPAGGKLHRWFKRWPPRMPYGWGSLVKNCRCCASSASSYYGTNLCGCTGLPSVIHATFSNSTKCPQLDGQTVALHLVTSIPCNNLATQSQTGWEYTFTYGTCTIKVQFYCQSNNTWAIRITEQTCNCQNGATVTSAGTCTPLNVSFTGILVPLCFNAFCGTTGCNGGGGATWNVTVTL